MVRGLSCILAAGVATRVSYAYPVQASFCPTAMKAVYADMHDGDKKEVVISDKDLRIKPSGNNQTWFVDTLLDHALCQATVDFRVTGKPGPPPCALEATLWETVAARSNQMMAKKFTYEFTDPTGKLAAADFPLNKWVQLPSQALLAYRYDAGFCPESFDAIYADMHDGDKKQVVISGSSMTIKPSGNNQTWVVHATLDRELCQASINFNVPGKPGFPPVNLMATFWASVRVGADDQWVKKSEYEFTDPSGTLAAADFPLNRWVQLPSNSPVMV